MKVLAPLLGIALVVSAPACSRKIDNAVHVDGIRAQVESTPPWVEPSALGKKLWAIERGFYESRGYMPAWVDGDRTTPHMKDLVQQFKYSELHGLDPGRYPIDGVRAPARAVADAHGHPLRRQGGAGTRRQADLRVPALRGRPDRMEHQPEGHLAQLADRSERQRIWPRALPMRLPRTRSAKASKRSLPTTRSTRASRPRWRAKRRTRPATVDRLLINLERWRWAPRDLGDRYVLVNVPAYILQVMEGSEPVLSMRVIVGKPATPTPLFSDEMTYVVFSPYWNIPQNILRDETLPRVMKDPDFLRRNNMEVVGTSGTIDPEEAGLVRRISHERAAVPSAAGTG